MTSVSDPLFAVVIPMYNEEVGAERCIRTVLTELHELTVPCLLITVNDGSRDGTSKVLDNLHQELSEFTLLHRPQNGGYGAGLRTGAEEAQRQGCHYVMFMDSDLTNPPADIVKFIPVMQQGIDVIKGCRFGMGGRMIGVPVRRRIMTTSARWLTACLLRVGVRDCTNGFRAIKTEVFLKMPLQERAFPIIMEEMYWAKSMGCTFANVPTTLYNRAPDQRPTLFSYNYKTMGAYLRYALKAAFIGRSPRDSH